MPMPITRDNAHQVIAENLELIVRNHITLVAVKRLGRDLQVEEVVANAHLIDRAGAIVNALKALGYHWDGADLVK